MWAVLVERGECMAEAVAIRSLWRGKCSRQIDVQVARVKHADRLDLNDEHAFKETARQDKHLQIIQQLNVDHERSLVDPACRRACWSSEEGIR